jgi:predicted AAA+ superfamily ATPase
MSEEGHDIQLLGAAIVQLIMDYKASPKCAALALVSVLLPTLHQERFDKDRALSMIDRVWDEIVERSFKQFEEKRKHPN